MEDQPRQRTFILYDPETGAVAGSHTVDADFEAENGEDPLALVREGVRELAGDEALERLEAAEVDTPEEASGGVVYDRSSGALVPAPELRLEPAITELEGDGEDSTEIAITAVTPDGKTDTSYSGELRVSATHGRLSERGGRVNAEKGEARITLTSVVATHEWVVVIAVDPVGAARPGRTKLEFV